MIAAGKLRHRVSLQAKTTAVDPLTGDRTQAWQMVADNLPAEVSPVSGREFMAAAAAQSVVTARITIRYRTGVTHQQRIVHGANAYNIEAVLPDKNSGREYLTLMCSEGAGDG